MHSHNLSRVTKSAVFTAFILILGLGYYLRGEVVEHTKTIAPIRADAARYTAYAYNLRLHGIYSSNISTANHPETKPAPDAVRSPGYPLLLYFLVAKGDFNTFIIRVAHIQKLIGILSVVLAGYIAYLVLGTGAAIAVSMLCAISPHLINMEVYVLSETWFAFLMLSFILLMILAYRTGRKLGWVMAASVLALSSLTRPTFQFFIVFLLPLIWLSGSGKNKIRLPVIVALVFFGIFSLWAIRNLVHTGQISNPALTINAIHHGMYPGFMHEDNPDTYPFPYKHDPGSAHISKSIPNALTELVLRFRDDPTKMIQWYLLKPFYLFQWSTVQGIDSIFIYEASSSPYYMDEGIFPASFNIMKNIHPGLVWLSIFGLVLSFLPNKWTKLNDSGKYGLKLLASIYAYFILVHIVAPPFPRYSIPIRPITYILALYPVYIILNQSVRRFRRNPGNT